MERTSVAYFTALTFICSGSQMHGQQVGQAKNDSMFAARAAGERYQAGGLHKFFFGKHYRDEWTTPVNVPYLDLGSFAGGLTPIKEGGRRQTKSLRFEATMRHILAARALCADFPAKDLPVILQSMGSPQPR